MNIEFHYWLTGIIAEFAGFDQEEAKIIAYSSQYVDDNDVGVKIKDRETDELYINYISQTIDITKPKNELMRIYPIFHFVPGKYDTPSALRKDGKLHLLNTTPNNDNAKKLLFKAFKADRHTLYRIGIASHTYADTWAHQNFVGWYESFNAIGTNLAPNIGHADAGHDPDIIGHKWNDNRLLKSEVNNTVRFLAAAQELFQHYRNYLINTGKEFNSNNSWDKLEELLIELMFPVSTEEKDVEKVRREGYKKAAPWLPEYDENDWFRYAVNTDVKGLKDSTKGLLAKLTLFKDRHYWRSEKIKENTHWYQFQEAVKAHEACAIEVMSERFAMIGIDLSKA